VSGGPGWVSGVTAQGLRPAATQPDQLENVLRASVAREETRKMAHEDLYEAIEKRRSELLEDLARARKTRDEISANIKLAQDALDALPVPKTRRSKKTATSNPATALGHE
jgi:hypothetical protein